MKKPLQYTCTCTYVRSVKLMMKAAFTKLIVPNYTDILGTCCKIAFLAFRTIKDLTKRTHQNNRRPYRGRKSSVILFKGKNSCHCKLHY